MKSLLMAIVIALTSSICSSCASSEPTKPFDPAAVATLPIDVNATARANSVCLPCPGSEQAELFDTDWLLQDFLLSNEPMPSKSLMLLSFKGEYVGGFGGCKGFGGRRDETVYDRSNGKLILAFEVLPILCESDADAKFERAYLDGLVRVQAYESDGKKLTLIDKEGHQVAVYRRYYSPSP